MTLRMSPGGAFWMREDAGLGGGGWGHGRRGRAIRTTPCSPRLHPPSANSELVPRTDPHPWLLPEMTTRPGSECHRCRLRSPGGWSAPSAPPLGDSGETCHLQPCLDLLSASAVMTWSFPSVLHGLGQLCDGLPAQIRAVACETSHTLCTGHCVPSPVDHGLLPCDRAPRAAESDEGL